MLTDPLVLSAECILPGSGGEGVFMHARFEAIFARNSGNLLEKMRPGASSSSAGDGGTSRLCGAPQHIRAFSRDVVKNISIA